MQFDWIRLPGVYVYESSGIATEGRRYQMADLLGGVRMLLCARVLLGPNRWLVPALLANKVHVHRMVLLADRFQRLADHLQPHHPPLLPEAPRPYR